MLWPNPVIELLRRYDTQIHSCFFQGAALLVSLLCGGSSVVISHLQMGAHFCGGQLGHSTQVTP